MYSEQQPPPWYGTSEQQQMNYAPGTTGPTPQDLSDPDRGVGKMLLVAGGIAAVMIGGAIYHKQKKKKKIRTKFGKSKEIEVNSYVDQYGNELPGQEFDKHGNLVNEQEILAQAQPLPPPPSYYSNQQQSSYPQTTTPNYGQGSQENVQGGGYYYPQPPSFPPAPQPPPYHPYDPYKQPPPDYQTY